MHVRHLIQNTLVLMLVVLPYSIFSDKDTKYYFAPSVMAIDFLGQPMQQLWTLCNISASNLPRDGSSAGESNSGFNVGPAGSSRAGQMPVGLVDASPEERIKQAIAYAYHDVYCKQHFHMSLQQKNSLMSVWRYKKFMKNLLEYQDLEDEIVWELWHEFVWSKTLHGDDQCECEQIIKKELQRRGAQKNRAHQKLLEEQRAITKSQEKQEAERKAEELRLSSELELQRLKEQQSLEKQQESQKLQEQRNVAEVVRLTSQQEAVQNRMRSLGLDPEQCLYLPSDFDSVQAEYVAVEDGCNRLLRADDGDMWHLRQVALQKTRDENFAQSWQDAILSEQAQGYLIACDLNPNFYTQCYGTALQHEINRQNCVLLESIAQLQRDKASKSLFLNHATQCIDASWWANTFEAVNLAIGLQDLGNACSKVGAWIVTNGPLYAQAVADGVVESTWDFMHMVRHPREMLGNMSKAAWFVLDTIALADEDMIGAGLSSAYRDRQQRFDQIHHAVVSIENSIVNSTGPERVKMITKFTSDCVFQHKALQVVAGVAGVLRAQAGSMRTMEFATDLMSRELACEGVAERIIQATQELEGAVQKSVVEEVMQLGGNAKLVAAQVTQKATRPLIEIMKEIRLLDGQIPLSNVALCEEVKLLVTQLVAEANCVISKDFLKEYSWKMYKNGALSKRVNLDIEHIVNYSCEFIENNMEQSYKILIKGGHLAGSAQALEATGCVKIVQKTILQNGCVEYNLQEVLTGLPITKTEFPACWDYKKLIQSCWEAYENPLIADYVDIAPKLIREGMTSDGFKLSLVLKKPNEITCNIVTALPITKKC